MKMPSWSVERIGDQRNVCRITSGESLHHPFRAAFMSDVHLDSSHCKIDLWRSHMRYLKAEGIPLIINGDFFDAMQGKMDRRSSKAEIRPELLGGDYLGKVVKFGADELEPFVDNIAFFGYGNHETAISGKPETDILVYLATELKARTGKSILLGGYDNWIRIIGADLRSVINIYTHHGSGGGAPVTRGVMEQQRTAAYTDADIIVHGHNHHANWTASPVQGLNDRGYLEFRMQHWLRVPGYKDEASISQGWAKEKAMPPKPFGFGLVTMKTRRKNIGDDGNTVRRIVDIDARIIVTESIL